ncbi:transcriptional regulator [Weissella diestrammenae]|uniref:Transcriptional regulator n=1 Tax=Weissella diestrammenae TaxID=1162633 RepID=A0A7G9T6Y3_9LACO|nr:transcriptional regulator [Weissella diestrammenae]MCM0582545.1 transcriptional regulator [Weissella diestrammenae]QNN75858.1 transcriptional regulator [Weissella diestrammenae]
MNTLKQIQTTGMAAIMQEPFIHALATGTLTDDIADYYTAQDNQYITAFEPLVDTIDEAFGLTRPFVDDETAAHLSLSTEIAKQPMDANGQAYVAHMQAATALSPIAGTMAILPCVESYHFIANHIANQSPYRAWTGYYQQASYARLVSYYQDILAKYDYTDYLSIYADSYTFEQKFWRNAFMKGTNND